MPMSLWWRSIRNPGSNDRPSMFGRFWSSTFEPARPPPRTSKAASVSTPYASRKTRASASTSMLTATISWLAAFTVWPAPLGPTCTIVLPTASKTALASSKSAASPPTMMDSTALRAPASPPETGASSIRKPFSRACSARAAVTSGRMLEKSMTRVPGSACSKTPPSPARTPSTSGESGTITATTSAPLTASAIEPAARPPASTSGWSRSGERLTPQTSKPAFCRWTDMGWPMMPRPMKAMVVMRVLLAVEVDQTVLRRALGSQRQAGVGAGGRLVLEAHPAVVPAAGEVAEQPVQVELAGPGLATTGPVGDLHVGGDLGVRGDRGVEVVTVVGQVEQVAQEADVGVPVPTDGIDDRDGVGSGAQRVGLRTAHRLDQDGGADALRLLGGRPELLTAEVVLGFWCGPPRPGCRRAR